MVLIKNPLSGGGGGGGDVVNGIVQEYLASSSDVEAGTFVEFVNTIGANTQLVGSSVTVNAEAVALEDGKVFIAFRQGSTGARYAVIATISGGAVSFGTEVLLSTNTTQSYPDTYVGVSPDKSKVLVSWRATSTASAIIGCSVSGTTITVGTEATIPQASGGAGTQGIKFLEDGKAFWGFAYSATASRGVVVSVASDLTLTVGTATAMDTSVGLFDMEVLNSTTVLAIEKQTSSSSQTNNPYAYKITISGDTITVGSRTSLKVGALDAFYSLTSGVKDTTVRLSNTDAVFVFTGRPSGRTTGIGLWACRITTNGSLAVVAGNEIFGYGSTNDYTSDITGAVLFAGSDGPYAVINYNSGYLKLAKLRPAISGVAIKEFQAIATGSSVNTYGGAIIGANGLVFYGGSTNMYAYPLIAKVKPVEVEISGLTKTEATTSSAGDVYVLNN